MLLMAAFLFTYPLFLQLTFDYTAMETGVALLPYSFGVLVPAVLGGKLGARYSARRLVQAGLGLGAAGLAVLAFTIQPDISVTDVASGVLFGLGMGLVASQIVNLILSSGTSDSASEIAGLNGTFEQLGNSIGVALVGSLMIATLSTGVARSVMHTDLPPEEQTAVVAAAESGIELMSDASMQAALDEAGASDASAEVLADVYSDARSQAFKAAMMLLAFLAVVALMFTPGLVDRKLGGSQEPSTA
jgi:predicted MFS family arabinose efflux permease